MAKLRVHLAARRFGVSSRELLTVLRESLAQDVRGPSSTLTASVVAQLAEHYGLTPTARSPHPYHLDRLKVAAAKKDLGIATAIDLHELELAARTASLSEAELLDQLMRPSLADPPRRRKRKSMRHPSAPKSAEKKRAKAAPRKSASAEKKRTKSALKEQLSVVTAPLGYRQPKRFEGPVRSVVPSGLPTLGQGRR